jgi:hypothetical protein
MRRGARHLALLVTGLALLLVAALFLSAWKQFERTGLFAQIRLLAEAPDTWQAPADGGQFGRTLSKQAGISAGKLGIHELLTAQQWLGNQVCCAEVATALPQQAWARAQAGQGLSCGGMAQLFHEMAAASGVPARVVQLYRSDFDSTDTHVLVEVQLDDGRWAIFDPTFNLTFEDAAGAMLGVQDVRARLASGQSDDVLPRYHGKRVYPADIDDYYIDWRVLHASAYVVRPCPDCNLLQRLPPLRYWYGPVRYAYGDALGPLARGHNHHYFTVVVAYPLLGALLSLVFIRLLIAGRRD